MKDQEPIRPVAADLELTRLQNEVEKALESDPQSFKLLLAALQKVSHEGTPYRRELSSDLHLPPRDTLILGALKEIAETATSESLDESWTQLKPALKIGRIQEAHLKWLKGRQVLHAARQTFDKTYAAKISDTFSRLSNALNGRRISAETMTLLLAPLDEDAALELSVGKRISDSIESPNERYLDFAHMCEVSWRHTLNNMAHPIGNTDAFVNPLTAILKEWIHEVWDPKDSYVPDDVLAKYAPKANA